MAAPAEIEPRRCLVLLKEIRNLYGQYQNFFLPVPASGKKLALTLSSLKDGINRFHIKYNSGNDSLSAFHELTLGLSDTLLTLQSGLRAYAHEYGSGMLDAGDPSFELDAASMKQLHIRLHPMSMGVDIINEAMELALIESSGTRPSETIREIYKRIDEAENSSARLSTLVNNFIYGITSQTKLETTDGRDLHTFTSANISHREIGQTIAAKLKQKTQEAVGVSTENEARWAWMIRHSIYWLSRSMEDLKEWKSENDFAHGCHTKPASDKASHTTAKIFLDAIKAAWLLGDLDDLRVYEKTSFEIREVIACTKKKVLALLQSFYRDIFSVPNYDLINEQADFSICTDDERKEEKPSQTGDSRSVLSSPVSEAETLHRQPTDPLTFPAELEAGSLISPVDSDSHNILAELHSNPSTSMESTLVHPDADSVHTARISTLTDGLHVARLEDLSADHRNIDLFTPGLRENELFSAENDPSRMAWAGFRHDVFSIESSPPHDTAASSSSALPPRATSTF